MLCVHQKSIGSAPNGGVNLQRFMLVNKVVGYQIVQTEHRQEIVVSYK